MLRSELAELQEISRQWLLDLEYFGHDLKEFQKLLGKACYDNCSENLAALSELLLRVAEIECARLKIITSVTAHSKMIEPLMEDLYSSIPLTLIKQQTSLENQVNAVFKSYTTLKNDAFLLTSYEMKIAG